MTTPSESLLATRITFLVYFRDKTGERAEGAWRLWSENDLEEQAGAQRIECEAGRPWAETRIARQTTKQAWIEDKSPAIEWTEVRAGDVISLLVFSGQHGLERERRRVVGVEWPKIALAEGERVYSINASDKDSLKRSLRLESRES